MGSENSNATKGTSAAKVASAASTWRANAILIFVTALWGFGFVAQRVGMDHLGVYTYNAFRFSIGSLALLLCTPLIRRFSPAEVSGSTKTNLLAGATAGTFLFIASTLQTAGLSSTSAGKAGFITGFYVILVPLMGLLWKQRTGPATWMGGLLALAGLYFLSVTETFSVSTGDLLVFLSAFFWAAHIQTIGHFSRKTDPLKLSIYQYIVVSFLSIFFSLLWEHNTLAQMQAAGGAILYGGVIVVGVSFTLQAIAQREAHPGHAAIIMNLESLFAVIAGWLLLGEKLTPRSLAGCALMLAGMILSQVGPNLTLSGLARLFTGAEKEQDLT
jgi:drug/metabolite transporter (DMT)-like permease